MYDWDEIGEELALPNMSYLIPNAPDPFYNGYSWYDLPPNPQPGIYRSRLLLQKIFDEIYLNGFPPSKCILFGFSQGCLMTLEFGSRYPIPLLGYIGMSGHVHDPYQIIQERDPGVTSKPNWLVTHGLRDEHLSVEITRAQMLLLIQAGFQIEYREFDKTHTVDYEAELPYIRKWIEQRCR